VAQEKPDPGVFRYESEYTDEELGMHRGITRRDFVEGFAVAAGTVAVSGSLAWGSKALAQGPGLTPDPAAQPPQRVGLRGTYPRAWEVSQRLEDGTIDPTRHVKETGEQYDLVVVGGGISGLSAAYFFLRDVKPDAKILVIDPHDDFGGHAKRNEFIVPGLTDPGTYHRRVTNAGSQSMDHVVSDSGWTAYGFAEARRMLDEIGIDFDQIAGTNIQSEVGWPSGGPSRTLWPREIWGAPNDVLQLGLNGTNQILQGPMDPVAKQQRVALNGNPNFLAHIPPAERVEILKQNRAAELLVKYADRIFGEGQQLHPHVLKHIDNQPVGGTGLPYSLAPGLDGCIWNSLTGIAGLDEGFETIPGVDYPNRPIPGVRKTAVLRWNSEGGDRQFADGNAGITRHLVRFLIPDALQAPDTLALYGAYTDYSTLDRPTNKVRIRLDSTVVRVQHQGNKDRSKWIFVNYVDHRTGQIRRVKARAAFLGCWNGRIPFIVPELPTVRREALSDSVKMPMLYLRVCLSNYRAFMEAGTTSVSFPGGYWPSLGITGATRYGPAGAPVLQNATGPDDPVLMNATKGFTRGLRDDYTLGGWTSQEGSRMGQIEMLNTTFEDFERSVRDYLVRGMQGTSFDPERDIAAICVNRWPQGYSRYYHLPNDAAFWKDFGPDLLPVGDTPGKIGAAPWGRMTMGTTDAGDFGFCETSILTAYEGVKYLGTVL
jgi:spermidine dehydrogenase